MFGTHFAKSRERCLIKTMEDLVMKRLVVIAAIVLSAANIFASELVIKGNVDIPFSVIINGEKYYSYNNKVTVTNLSRGRYGMEIYTEGNSNELLYDYSIDVPWSSTVYATFTGDNKMYISTSNNTPNVVVHLNPYPRRVVVPVYHQSARPPRPCYHSTPAPTSRHYAAPAHKPHHHATPASKPHHHAAPAPKSGPKHAAPAPKNNSKPSAPNHGVAKPHNEKSSSTTVRASSAPTSRAATSRSTTSTRR